MKRVYWCVGGVALCAATLYVLWGASSSRQQQDLLWHYRNLSKAFYENPTTQVQAVDEFKKALALAPTSARERLNYGLALLRAAKTKEGIAELIKAQQQDPKIPHTWFNLGIAYKKDSEYDKAVTQLERMTQSPRRRWKIEKNKATSNLWNTSLNSRRLSKPCRTPSVLRL